MLFSLRVTKTWVQLSLLHQREQRSRWVAEQKCEVRQIQHVARKSHCMRVRGTAAPEESSSNSLQQEGRLERRHDFLVLILMLILMLVPMFILLMLLLELLEEP